MSCNTLSNFGVPGINGERQPILQPIFKNRWRAVFYGFGEQNSVAPYDLTRQIQSISIPSLKFDTYTLWSYLSAIYVTSRAEWDQITVSFMDDISNTARTLIERQAARQQNFRDVTASRAAENYKFSMDLSILAGGATGGDNDPNILRTYVLCGCHMVDYTDGTLDYTDAGPKTIEVTIRPDNVTVLDHYGIEMIEGVSHELEIQNRSGISSTGVGTFGSSGISVNSGGASISGRVTLTGSANFGFVL